MSFLDRGDLYGKTFKEKVYLATDIAKSVMAIMLEAHPNIPLISNLSTHKCLVLVHHNILLHLSYTVGFSLIRNITFSAVKF